MYLTWGFKQFRFKWTLQLCALLKKYFRPEFFRLFSRHCLSRTHNREDYLHWNIIICSKSLLFFNEADRHGMYASWSLQSDRSGSIAVMISFLLSWVKSKFISSRGFAFTMHSHRYLSLQRQTVNSALHILSNRRTGHNVRGVGVGLEKKGSWSEGQSFYASKGGWVSKRPCLLNGWGM